MARSKTLLQLRTAVINEASIDGQTGTNGRHSPTSLNELINRYIESLLSLVGGAGGPALQVLDSITPIPAATANEDFIEITYPSAAEEIVGVDVLTSGSPKWGELDPADWSQRRLLNFEHGAPEGGIGWWAVKSMPIARAQGVGSIVDGKIALFPRTLSGSYRVTYVEQWTDMTDDAHVFVAQADWHTWVINSVVMQLTKRDTNKKANFAAAKIAKDDAEARILKASKRTAHGSAVPKRVGGELF